MPRTFLIQAMLVIVLVLAPGAGAVQIHKAPGQPDSAKLDINFASPAQATLTLDQEWLGTRAVDMRQSLDAFFGNGDDKLVPDEITKITTAASTDMRNKTFDVVTLDGSAARVTDVTVTLEGANLNDTASGSLILHHVVTLAFTPAQGDTHAIVLQPRWNGTFTLHAPAGLEFQGGTGQDFSGSLQSGVTQKLTMTTAPVVSSTPPTSVVTVTAAPPPTSTVNTTNTTKANESTSNPRPVPAPGILVTVGAMGLLALLASRKRRAP